MHRWAACPGSVVLSEGIESKSSQDAKLGTAAHALAEACLNQVLDAVDFCHWWALVKEDGSVVFCEPSDHINHANSETPFLVNDEMADAVQVYLNFIRGLLQADDGAILEVEHRFHLKDIDEDCFGTSDAVVWSPGTRTLYVIDYKHGAGVAVEAAGNPQLRYYALGALLELKYKAAQVVSVIVQPRCFHADGPIRQDTIPVLELLDWSAELSDAVFQASKASDEFREIDRLTHAVGEDRKAWWANTYLTTGDHCRWCPASPECPKKIAQAYEVAGVEFKAVTPSRLGELMALADQLEPWIKSLRQFAYDVANAGNEVPGWKLVEKRATRKWASEGRAAEFLQEYIDSPYEKKIITPAEAEKRLKSLKVPIPDELVVKESSGTTLVPVDDKRASVKRGSEFLPTISGDK